MFLKVKRLQQFDDLLLEADIIRFGDQFADINQNFKAGSSEDNQEGQTPNSEIWNRFDALIDMLLDKGIIDLAQELKKPIYEKEFGSKRGEQITTAYLEYCKNRLSSLSKQINEELSKEEKDNTKIEQLIITRVQIAARIESLERIYSAFKLINDKILNDIADDIVNKISDIKKEVTNQYTETLVSVGKVIQPEIIVMTGSNASDSDKEESAETIISALNSLDRILPFYPRETQDSAKHAKARVESTIEKEIGKEKFETIKQYILDSDEEAKILRRILNLKHMNFSNEDEIFREVSNIKISINGLEGNKRGRPLSKPEVIEYLKKVLDEESAIVLNRARSKTITLKESKGIHYDFKTSLTLHKVVDLPVTGKQIADASWLMKFRKRFTAILGLLPAGEQPMTAAGQAFADFGQQTHNLYARTLNSAGKFIGRLFKGREGEMKGDAITRLFIPDTQVIDKPFIPIKEDGGAPGVAMQVPGSIGSMGPIHAPTPTEFGSGDNFNPEKKKKKKKKSIFEERMSIMDFANFLKNNES